MLGRVAEEAAGALVDVLLDDLMRNVREKMFRCVLMMEATDEYS